MGKEVGKEGERDFLLRPRSCLLRPHLNSSLPFLALPVGQLYTVGHLPLWACLIAFPHGKQTFLYSYNPLAALIGAARSVFCAGECNGGPDGKELLMSSLVLSHKTRRVLPGTTPLALLLKMLSLVHRCLAIFAFPLTFEIGNICPFGSLDLCKDHARSLKTYSFKKWAILHSPFSLQNSKMVSSLLIRLI